MAVTCKGIALPGCLDADATALGGARPIASAAYAERASQICAVGSAASATGAAGMVAIGRFLRG